VSHQLGADMAINADSSTRSRTRFNASVQINTPLNGVRPRPEWAVSTRCSQWAAEVPRAARPPGEAAVEPLPVHGVVHAAEVEDNSFGATSTGTITDFYHPEFDAGTATQTAVTRRSPAARTCCPET